MKFLIRDDDTCAFTAPEKLVKCYAHIWDKVPVNLSVTPFRIPGNDKSVPKYFNGRAKPIPLENNSELVEFLKEKQRENKVHVAMHGYHHSKPKGLPEYVGETDLFEKTKEGKSYLEELLDCHISTFVPPNNALAREGFIATVENGLNLINIPSLIRPGRRPFHFENIPNFLKIKYYWYVKKMSYPHVLNFHDHKEISYFSVTPSQRMDTLIEAFEHRRKVNGVFIFSVHYHAFDRKLQTGETIRDVLMYFLDMTSKVKDMQYLNYYELWKA